MDIKVTFLNAKLSYQSPITHKLRKMHAALVAALIIVGLIFIAMGLLRPDFNFMISCSPDSFSNSGRLDLNFSDKGSFNPSGRNFHG